MCSKQTMLQLMLLAQLSTACDSTGDSTSKAQAATPASTAGSEGRHLCAIQCLPTQCSQLSCCRHNHLAAEQSTHPAATACCRYVQDNLVVSMSFTVTSSVHAQGSCGPVRHRRTSRSTYNVLLVKLPVFFMTTPHLSATTFNL